MSMTMCLFVCLFVSSSLAQYYMKYEKMARNEQSSQVTRQVGTEDSQKAEPGPVRSAGKAADTAQPASNCPGAVAAGKPATSVTSHAAATATSSQASHTFVDTSDSYNGDVTDRFSWSQTTTDVDIKVPLPAGVNTSQLCVSIQATHIRVAVKTSGGEDVLLDGELSERIRPSECMWTKDGSKLVLSLEKCKDYMWKTVFIGDKEIDLNAIDNTRHLTDYDDETQTGVRKAMYDQEQRMKGLPTSDEQKTLSALEGAWNAEGSPFKGTPFDPSTINLSGSSLGGLPSQDPA